MDEHKMSWNDSGSALEAKIKVNGYAYDPDGSEDRGEDAGVFPNHSEQD